MIALDTNVLLRALVDDPTAPQQCVAARALIANAGGVRISAIVFIETLWVIARSYGASRAEVNEIATRLLEHSKYRIGDADRLRVALEVFARTGIDFSDAVALADARNAECVLYTFDRKLARVNGTAYVDGS